MPNKIPFSPFATLEELFANVEKNRREFFPTFDPNRYEDFFTEYNEAEGYKILRDPEKQYQSEIIYFEDHLRTLFYERVKEVEENIISLRMLAGKNNWSDYSNVLKKKLKLISEQNSEELSSYFRYATVLFDSIVSLIDYYGEHNFPQLGVKSKNEVHNPKLANKRKLTTLLDEPLNDETLRYLHDLRLSSNYFINRETSFETFKEVINSKNLQIQKENNRSIKFGCPTKHAVLVLDVLKPLIPRILRKTIIEPFRIFNTKDNSILTSGNASSSLTKAKKQGSKLDEDVSNILQIALQYQKGK
jgi:hypothetical protein